MSSCTSTASKICLAVIGFVFWAVAGGMIFLGSWVYKTYHHFNEITTANFTLIPASIVIGVGVVMFIIGTLGCVSVCKDNRCVLAVFFSLMLVVLTALLLAGVLGYVFRSNLEETVEDGLKDALMKYPANVNTSTSQKHQIDFLQSELHCCGVERPADWADNNLPWAKNNSGHVPVSCCNRTHVPCDTSVNSTDLYTDGCVSKLEGVLNRNLFYVAAIAITFAAAIFLGMICSCILMCRSKEVRYEILGGPNSGLRV